MAYLYLVCDNMKDMIYDSTFIASLSFPSTKHLLHFNRAKKERINFFKFILQNYAYYIRYSILIYSILGYHSHFCFIPSQLTSLGCFMQKYVILYISFCSVVLQTRVSEVFHNIVHDKANKLGLLRWMSELNRNFSFPHCQVHSFSVFLVLQSFNLKNDTNMKQS